MFNFRLKSVVFLSAFSISLLSAFTGHSQIKVNELLIRQSDVYLSYFGNFDSMIEILNTESSDVNLGVFYLSDDPLNLQKWQFPNTPILANAFALVYLSGRNITAPQMHTNFKLSETETLYLSDAAGVIESISPVSHHLNISYARFPDGEDEFQFTAPSMGQTNVSGVSSIPSSPLNLTPMGVLAPGSNVQFAQVDAETRYSSDGFEVDGTNPLLPPTISLPDPNTFNNRFSAVEANPGMQFPLFDYTESRANTRGYVPPFGMVKKINIIRVKPFTTSDLELEERVYTYFPETPT